MRRERLFSVGTKVKEIRESKGWTASELAQKLGWDKQRIWKYEQDFIKNIPYQTIKEMADCLDVNPAYLVGWSNSIERTPDIVGSQTEVKSDLV